MHDIFDLGQREERRQVHTLLVDYVIAICRVQTEEEVLNQAKDEHESSRDKLLVGFLGSHLLILHIRINFLILIDAFSGEKHGPLQDPEQQIVYRKRKHHVLPVDPLRNINYLHVLYGVFDREEQLEGKHSVEAILTR